MSLPIDLKSQSQLTTMRKAGRIVWEVLQEMAGAAQAGVSTLEIDRLGEARTREKGAIPAFKGYRGFPASVCISLNQEVVHGIPSKKRKLQSGDLLKLDFGVILDGLFGDSAITVPVGEISAEAQKLIDVTRESMHRGIAMMQPDKRLHDIGHAVQAHVEAAGFSVVRDFVGHGIGHRLHEDPQLPNYGTAGTGMRLRAGMCLAIEPMVNVGTYEVEVLSDGWTAVTADGALSAHFEHSVAIGPNGPEILTLPDGVAPGKEGLRAA
jgi:methionyl aminopeptidase